MLCLKRLQELKSRYPDRGSAKGLFLEAKDVVNDYDQPNLFRACAFYVINKCSFSGLTESSSFSAQASESNFSMRGIEKLPGYTQIIQNWKITNLSYEQLLTDDKNVFTYLDPPYDIRSNLYGRKGVCITDSVTMVSLPIVIGLLVLNSYLIIRLNWSKTVSKGGK